MNKNIKNALFGFGIILIVAYIGLLPNISNAQVNISNSSVNNLNVYTSGSDHSLHSHTTICEECKYSSYRLVNYLRCGAVITIGEAEMPKPICSLAPAITPSGAIELQWTTVGATIAFIDSGIGHVNTISGSRIVTPTKDTAYNMTVLNDAGIAGSCGAVIKVKVVVDPVDPVDPTDPTDPVDPDDPVDPKPGTGGLFGDAFKSIAIPIGIVFLILIVLLVFIMSKVKGSK